MEERPLSGSCASEEKNIRVEENFSLLGTENQKTEEARLYRQNLNAEMNIERKSGSLRERRTRNYGLRGKN